MSRTAPLAARFDAGTLRRQSARGAAVTFFTQGLKFCVQFCSTVVLTRLLGPADFGLMALVTPLLSFVKSLNDLGFGQAVVQTNELNQSQVSWLFWLNLATSTGLAIAVMLAAPAIGWLYGDPKVTTLTIALASLLIPATLSMLPSAILNRQLRFISLSIAETLAMAAGAAVGITSAYAGLGYWSLVLMQATNTLTILPLIGWLAGWWPSAPARERNVGSLLRFGINMTGSNLATYFAMAGDNIIIGMVRGKVALGFYDRSYNLVVQPLMQVMGPVSRIAVPLLSRLSDDPPRFSRAYLQLLQFALAMCVPGLLFLIFTAPAIVLLLFGSRWHSIAPIVAWVCVGGLMTPLNASASWIFTAQNRTHEQLIYVVLNAGISLASFAIGVIWGVVGVACVSALTFAFIQTPLLIRAATRVGAVTLPVTLRAVMPFAVAGTASAVTLFCAHLDSHGVRGLLAALATSYAIFSLVLVCLPEGRRFLTGLLALRSTLWQMA